MFTDVEILFDKFIGEVLFIHLYPSSVSYQSYFNGEVDDNGQVIFSTNFGTGYTNFVLIFSNLQKNEDGTTNFDLKISIK